MGCIIIPTIQNKLHFLYKILKMKYKFIPLCIFCVILNIYAKAQTATLKGHIETADLTALAGATVALQNTAFTTFTDKNGDFTIANIPLGKYAVTATSVGYTASKQNVLITKATIIDLNLQLSEDKQTLEEVSVKSNTGRGVYKVSNSSVATRTNTALIEVPQSTQAITQQTIKDKKAFTLNEIATVITGVKANNGMGAFSIRGFTGYYPFDASFIAFNGVKGNLYLWSQAPLLYNIDKVEVLRGPSSVLMSEGIPGGTINFITKKPQAEKRYEINTTYGTWNMARVSLDATGAISKNKKLLYRAIVGYDRSNSFRDYQKVQNAFFAPSLTYNFSAKTKVNVEVNYAYAKTVQQYDRGVFVKKNTDGTYDFNFYPNNISVQSPTDFGKTNNSSVTASFAHQFNENAAITVTQRYVRNKFNFADHVVSGAIVKDSIKRSYEIWDYDQYNYQTNAYGTYKVKTGIITQNFLAGIDYNNYGWSKNDYRNSPSTRIYILNPTYANDIPVAKPTDYYDDNKQNIKLTGFYLQDQISIKEKIKLLLSLRHDDYKMMQTPLSSKDDLQGDKSDASAWIPRVGLVYLPVNNISFYGNFTQSFSPQVSNSGSKGGPFPPRTAEQFEVGYKGEFFKSALTTMVSVYDIKYRNILAADPTPTNPNQQAVVDGTRSKGVELTVQGSIKNIALVAGYSYNEHNLTSNSTLGKEGDRFVNAPKNIANIFAKYSFATGIVKGFGLGAGGRYVSDQVGNLATQAFVVPASTVLDAMVNYEVKRYNFQLNVNNIADVRYFTGGLSRATIAALGNPRNFRLSINYLIH